MDGRSRLHILNFTLFLIFYFYFFFKSTVVKKVIKSNLYLDFFFLHSSNSIDD